MNPLRWFFAVFGLGLVGVFLQGTLLRFFLPPYLIPHIVMLLAFYLAFYEISVLGAVLAFVLGLLLDLSTGLLLGPWAAAFVSLYCVLALISDRIFVDSGLAAVVVAFFATLFLNIVFFLLAGHIRPAFGDWVSGSLSQAFVTALVVQPVLMLLRRVFRDRRAQGARAVYRAA